MRSQRCPGEGPALLLARGVEKEDTSLDGLEQAREVSPLGNEWRFGHGTAYSRTAPDFAMR